MNPFSWLWKAVSAGLGAVSLALVVALLISKGETRHFHKLADQNAALAQQYKADLDRISSEKAAQKIVTRTKIETVTRTIREKAKEAERVEQAPLKGECKTPDAVLQADL